MDPKEFPVGDKHIASGDIESSPTSTDLLEVYDAVNQNERKAISIANLLKDLDIESILTDLFKLDETEYTASGAIPATVSLVALNKSDGALAMTIAAPTPKQVLVIYQKDGGTQGHTVTLTAGTYDGTNDIATFNAQYEALVLIGVSATRYLLVSNIGSVALSAS